MPCRIVATTTAATIFGSTVKSCLFITRSISSRIVPGSTSPLARFTTISKKLPASSQRRGFTSFQMSGQIFFRLGFGRDFVSSAVVRASRAARRPVAGRHSAAKA